ncbi:ubiquinol-cytochrome C chaperone family protein [Sphingomonas colocasiae]|uniref:Ubiquinol-cytochrome C chaperone n=1 Tax=Sphingomonas colocasiae TaxID=1848973 RepID=A0ABS7PT98_9SPHN|nr:ubiquinol-cytochrome C chaperone [Sphingomonas colocasiae]
MSFLSRLFNRSSGRDALAPLYAAVVAEARNPYWYVEGGVADTIDGRFDMVAAILSIALVRLERESGDGAAKAALLTEIFVDDMDAQLRQQGIGDIVVGKHIGRMMSALGGRLTVYREGLTGTGDLPEALRRNLYRNAAPSEEALANATARMRTIAEAVNAAPVDRLLSGALVQP